MLEWPNYWQCSCREDLRKKKIPVPCQKTHWRGRDRKSLPLKFQFARPEKKNLYGCGIHKATEQLCYDINKM